MFGNHIIPIGEADQHLSSERCACDPEKVNYQGKPFLLHHAFDHREIWLAVEQMLGVTCYEHMDFVGPEYERGKPHKHVPPLDKHYEYPHEKIDPR